MLLNFIIWLYDFYVLASKGISANLLKLGTKRRRTKAEFTQLKEEEAFRVEAEANKDTIIAELRQQLTNVREESLNNTAAAGILTDMISKGHLK